MQKPVIRHMRTPISLRISAVWSGPRLSTKRIIRYYEIYERRASARMILCVCTRCSECVHFAHVKIHFLAWRDWDNSSQKRWFQVRVRPWVDFEMMIQYEVYFYIIIILSRLSRDDERGNKTNTNKRAAKFIQLCLKYSASAMFNESRGFTTWL